MRFLGPKLLGQDLPPNFLCSRAHFGEQTGSALLGEKTVEKQQRPLQESEIMPADIKESKKYNF